MPLVETIVTYDKKPLQCEILHHGECSCWIGRLYNQTKELQERYSTIQRKMQDVEEEVASMKEFRGLKEFAVMFQPFSRRLNVIKAHCYIQNIIQLLNIFFLLSSQQINRVMTSLY